MWFGKIRKIEINEEICKIKDNRNSNSRGFGWSEFRGGKDCSENRGEIGYKDRKRRYVMKEG